MQMPTIQYHNGSGDNVAGDKHVQYITQIFGDYTELNIGESEMHGRIKAYYKLLVREHSFFPMLGTEKALEIEKVFVTLSVATGNLSGEKSSIGTDGLSDNNGLLSDINPRRDLGSPHRLFWNSGVPINNIMFHSKAVVLGEPGIGKTTLLRRMLINICKGKVLTSFVPVFVSLADVNIIDTSFIYSYVKNKYKEYCHIIEHCIKRGKAIIFFDGLDEIEKKQQSILNEECSVLTAYGNKVIVSCRTTIFPRNLLSSDFKIFECIGFSVAQRRKFLRKWFDGKSDIGLRMEKLIQEEPGIWGMSRNPLLLSLIAIQFECNLDFILPPKRIDLYLQGIDELLSRRNVHTDSYISSDEKSRLLCFIAFHMFSVGKEMVSKEELRRYITQWCRTNNGPSLKKWDADSIIENVIEIDGIISPFAKGQYRFLHLTFQESLTAKYIFENKNWFLLFISKLHNPRWEETLRLLASQLSENSSKKLARFLYYRFLSEKNNGQLLCMIGRYMSELQTSYMKYQRKVFYKLLISLLTDKYAEMYNDVVVAISEMCNSYRVFSREFIGINERNINEGHLGWVNIYIQVLKLCHSSETTDALLRLLSFIISARLDHEHQVMIIGNLISALENSCEYDLWFKLFESYMDRDCSYLSAVLSKSLANILPIGFEEVLKKKSKTDTSYLSSLCQYVVFKYEDETEATKTIMDIFAENNIFTKQLVSYISDLDIQMSEENIKTIVSQCNDSISLALFLSMHFVFFSCNDYEFVKQIIGDLSKPLPLRYAALENFLIINANRKNEIESILHIIVKSGLTECIPVLIRVLERVYIPGVLGYAIDKTTSGDSKYIVSLLRLLSKEKYTFSMNWLIRVLNSSAKFSDVYLYAMLALCKQGYADMQPLLVEDLQDNKISAREKTVLLKALLTQNTDESIKYAISLLGRESDINTISLVIDMLRTVTNPYAEKALIQYLEFKKWPKKWPPPLPELKKGEQRQSDRRKLSVIIAAGNYHSRKVMALMKKIAYDKRESDDVRHAAFVAYKNMAWMH